MGNSIKLTGNTRRVLFHGLFFISMLSLFSFISCTDKDNPDPLNCDRVIEIDADMFENAPDNNHTINTVAFEDNCLCIEFSASGCSGDSWEIQLIDADVILESFPVQRNIRISLKNEEVCEAWITRKLCFDISPLQLENYDRILLNLDGYPEQIEYNY
jgi:hypothetical protein